MKILSTNQSIRLLIVANDFINNVNFFETFVNDFLEIDNFREFGNEIIIMLFELKLSFLTSKISPNNSIARSFLPLNVSDSIILTFFWDNYAFNMR